jgi:hypothetical protein
MIVPTQCMHTMTRTTENVLCLPPKRSNGSVWRDPFAMCHLASDMSHGPPRDPRHGFVQMARLRIPVENFCDLSYSSGQVRSGLGNRLGNAGKCLFRSWRNRPGYNWQKLAGCHSNQR